MAMVSPSVFSSSTSPNSFSELLAPICWPETIRCREFQLIARTEWVFSAQKQLCCESQNR